MMVLVPRRVRDIYSIFIGMSPRAKFSLDRKLNGCIQDPLTFLQEGRKWV